ncbi:NAD(P)-binding domain-containing protein [Streptomyces sp. NBC_01451]
MSSTTVQALRIAVLGLGEAGSAIAADLVAAGVHVRGYDPRGAALPGVEETDSESEAAADCDLVLSVNSAADAADALRAGLAGTTPGCLWADLNTASPTLKRLLGRTAGDAGTGTGGRPAWPWPSGTWTGGNHRPRRTSSPG